MKVESRQAHTPGSWSVVDDKQGVSVMSADSEYSICKLSIAAVHARSPSVARANARLIAAAPALLAALEACIEQSDMGITLKTRNEARAAIKTARGD